MKVIGESCFDHRRVTITANPMLFDTREVRQN